MSDFSFSLKDERVIDILIADEASGNTMFCVYSIILKEATTAAELLDWIFQVNQKEWATRELMGELLSVLEDATFMWLGKSVQSAFCPGGQPTLPVDWGCEL